MVGVVAVSAGDTVASDDGGDDGLTCTGAEKDEKDDSTEDAPATGEVASAMAASVDKDDGTGGGDMCAECEE